MSEKQQDWQQYALQDLLLESIKEQRRRRRWGIFFKSAFLILIILFFWLIVGGNSTHKIMRDKAHVALIDINGVIASSTLASADKIVTALRQAFKDKGTKGIILRINSPGGSPVQADYIYHSILQLRKQHPKIKVYAVCSDICASGAYYVAAAANDIYADPASLVGSIGVIMGGFGFVDTMKKIGVSRRVFTAGSNKDFLDPFSPLKRGEKAYAHRILNIVHQQFIHAVEQGRGARLRVQGHPEIGRAHV